MYVRMCVCLNLCTLILVADELSLVRRPLRLRQPQKMRPECVCACLCSDRVLGKDLGTQPCAAIDVVSCELQVRRHPGGDTPLVCKGVCNATVELCVRHVGDPSEHQSYPHHRRWTRSFQRR